MEEALAHSSKRYRDESAAESLEAKRFREADTVIEILDSDDDVDPSVDRDHPVDEIADAIRSLEGEIAVPGPPPLDLGYLLEASDDELGLPPPAISLPSTLSDGRDLVEIVDEEAGFDRIWGYEDEISIAPYEGLEFGFLTDFDDGSVIFDGGLFDYRDVECGPVAQEDLLWQAEIPAE